VNAAGAGAGLRAKVSWLIERSGNEHGDISPSIREGLGDDRISQNGSGIIGSEIIPKRLGSDEGELLVCARVC